MDFNLTEKELAFKEECEGFFREEMKNAPLVYQTKSRFDAMFEEDEGWNFHRYLQKKLAAKGWTCRAWPKEYGGQEASILEQLIFNEIRSYYRAPGVDFWGVGMFAPTLLVAASEEQKKRLLPPIAKGEVHYCQGWSEPNSGSDLASLSTKAIKDGDYYIVNGQKTWSTGAHRADHIFLLLRTDPASKGNAGLSVFCARNDLPGMEIRRIEYMNKRCIFDEIFFSDVAIPATDLIGQEGEGWRLTRETMNFERSGVDKYSESRSVLEKFIGYLKTTKRDGRLLSENPLVRQKIAKLYSDIEVGRTLAYKIAWLQEKGGLAFAASAASESKVFGSELLQRVSMVATESAGLYGTLEESEEAPLSGMMPDLYQMSIGGNIAMGTSEIQRNLIAWAGLQLPRK